MNKSVIKTNLKGRRFGKLKVLDKFKVTEDRHKMWLCDCKCGKQVWILGTNLNRGFSQSCGCSRKSNK